MKATRLLAGLRAVDGAGCLVPGTLAFGDGRFIGSDGDEGRGGLDDKKVCRNGSDLFVTDTGRYDTGSTVLLRKISLPTPTLTLHSGLKC